MKGIGPELPLNRDESQGLYSLVGDYKQEVKQNFKNLLLTAPGERMMNPDFGVGLRHFLFDPRPHVVSGLRQRIVQQVNKYLPFVKIARIQFGGSEADELSADSNLLSILIQYEVPSINLATSFELHREDVN